MEGKGLKTFVVLVLVLSLFGQTQVEAKFSKWCCMDTTGKGFFQECVSKGFDQSWCAYRCACIPMEHCGGEHPVDAGKNHYTSFSFCSSFIVASIRNYNMVETKQGFIT
jgi:hypothetical protein